MMDSLVSKAALGDGIGAAKNAPFVVLGSPFREARLSILD